MSLRYVLRAVWTGLAAAAFAVLICWFVLLGLASAGGDAGMIAGFLGTGPGGLAVAVAAATGAPVEWAGGRLNPILLLLDGSPLALIALGPALSAARLGLAVRRRAASFAVAAATGYAAALAAFVALAGALPADPLFRVHAPAGWVALTALAWSAVALLATRATRATRGVAVTVAPGGWPARTRRMATATALLLVAAGFTAARPAVAGPGDGRVRPFAGGMTAAPVGYHRPGVAAALEQARAERGGVALVSNDPWRGTPSMVGMSSPFGGDARAWLKQHAGLFGMADPGAQLRPLREQRDPTGERHLWFEQHIDGIPVLGSRVGLHLDRTGRTVEFVTNGAEPALAVPTTKATVADSAALATARLALPGGRLAEPVRLALLPADADPGRASPTVLAWQVWLADPAAGVSNVYFVDATGGRLVYALPRASEAKHRSIRDANKLTELPILPKRVEGQGPSDVADVNDAYDRLGQVYDYYSNVHSRDSYNGTGGDLNAVVRVRQKKDEKWVNAAFVPGDIDTMIYGEDMVVLDVTAHELTHGVTFSTADLWYMYQSGALNESFSDIFGEAVENYVRKSNDWLMGAEIPGIGAIRSMAFPEIFGDPDNYHKFKSGCGDWGGVHSNSGIQNKMFYLLSTKIGIEKAAKIAYRTLTTYLSPRARFTDSRVGFMESANKLYGKSSAEAKEAEAAWTAVGVDGVFEQPRQDCLCIADSSLSGGGLDGLDPQGPGVDAVLAAVLHVRDLFSTTRTPALRHYERVYALSGERAVELMGADPQLKKQTAHAVQTLEPMFRTVGTTAGDSTVITATQLGELRDLLTAYATADRAAGGGGLADRIETELASASFDELAGKTVNQALAFLDTRVG
ncbi:Zn-dependent metalloprotease [Actinoplanes tereljensis]|uniref:Uncharacterized protein n=1 Tax=Paractinoplanes tereljensis TaxID=571912 RepID=A0A919NS12_9ACTN|nr:M4 family metallopeptidase [Actinoplanes tereljensis]GIF23190.1 hypothetical protein Ate02nite_59200 [Actinoplanes tereljensis]